MLRRTIFAAAASLCLVSTVEAQVPVIDLRLGAHAVMPTGDLGDGFDTSFGLYGRIGAPTGPMKLMAALTWNRLKSKSALFDDLDVITIQAGPHFALTPLADFGVEAAYLTEFEDFGLSPSFSLSMSRFELTAAYTTTFDSPQANWISLGGGIRF